MTDYDVLRVFCAPNGGYGNELGVVREGSVLPDRQDRQDLAAKLGFGESTAVSAATRATARAIPATAARSRPMRWRASPAAQAV
ncbi:hypothetical protein AB0G80_36715, partial [Streptomyces asoensis]